MLTHDRFNTYMVQNFGDLNKAQIYQMALTDSLHQDIETLMSFKYLNLLKPNEHKEDYLIRKPNDESFVFEIGYRSYIYVGEKLVAFETNDKLVNYSSEIGFNDIKFAFAYSERKIYFVLHQRYITIEE